MSNKRNVEKGRGAFEGKVRKKRKGNVYLLVLLLILVCVSITGVSARYIQQRDVNVLARAKMFYFTSDMLTENGAVYELNPQTTSVTFSLRNHIDAFRETEGQIQYKVYVYTNGNKNPETLVKRAALNAENKTDEITFAVSMGNEYRVVAESLCEGPEGGYVKTISATFIVIDEPTGLYKHISGWDLHVVQLTVWTEAVEGDVTVRFPAGLVPDATDSLLAGVINYSNGTYLTGEVPAVRFGEFASRTYRFFKDDPMAKYHVSDFGVFLEDDDGDLKAAVAGIPDSAVQYKRGTAVPENPDQ